MHEVLVCLSLYISRWVCAVMTLSRVVALIFAFRFNIKIIIKISLLELVKCFKGVWHFTAPQHNSLTVHVKVEDAKSSVESEGRWNIVLILTTHVHELNCPSDKRIMWFPGSFQWVIKAFTFMKPTYSIMWAYGHPRTALYHVATTAEFALPF